MGAHGRSAGAGRAALAQALVRLRRDEWGAAAAALGFQPVPRRERPKPPPDPKRRPPPPPPRPPEPPPTADEPQPSVYAPADLPDLPFWRIAAVERATPDPDRRRVPRWLSAAEPWEQLPQADGAPPSSPELTAAPRQARFLRRTLARRQPGRGLDLLRLCDGLARGRIPERLPRVQRPRWPARAHLLLDLSPALRPYHPDLRGWAARLKRALGERLTLLVTDTGSPLQLERLHDEGRPPPAIGDGTPLIVLSDAGLYAPDGAQHRQWLALAARSRRAGFRPLLLAPVPTRLLTAAVSRGFRCAPLERGAPVRIARTNTQRGVVGRNAPAVPPAADTTDADQSRQSQPKQTPTDPATATLLAALAPGARTEPALLRRLRLLPGTPSPRQAPDIGAEQATWNHPDVVADELACALHPERRAAAEAAFRALPAATRHAILAARVEFHRGSSPFVRLEEALAALALLDGEPLSRLPAPVREAIHQALREAERWAATLHRGERRRQHAPLGAAIAGLGRRRPALLARHRELGTAWALARQTEIRAGALVALPPGVDPALLRWLLEPDAPDRAVVLAQQGDGVGLYAADSAPPAAVLATGALIGAYWELEPLATGTGQQNDASGPREPADQPSAPDPTAITTLRLDESRPLLDSRRWRVIAGDVTWTLEAIRRPDWVRGLGRDRLGLYAEPKPEVLAPQDKPTTDHDGPRCRLYWQPAGPLPVQGLEDAVTLTAGAWWDAELFQTVHADEAVLPAPDWAEAFGIDAQGLWAEFGVAGVIQRLRWLPPGEFLMGSPEDEPERQSNEQQHPVILTRGLWLADTACTQALWRAVLDEEPSHFKGPERPVEQVSWDDIVQRFLPALNRAVPGLQARLPTEAEWEFACRAGTTTPFSVGDELTTERANYDGNFPYAGGELGEYRGQTVDVNALPPNGWGLYQMHGNVYEWCEDWLSDYPRRMVKDPAGASAGRVRVLRGGSWGGLARPCRSALRGADEPANRSLSIGFRLARGSSPQAGQPAGRQGRGAGAAGTVAGGGAPVAEPAVPAPRPRKLKL